MHRQLLLLFGRPEEEPVESHGWTGAEGAATWVEARQKTEALLRALG